MTSDTRVHALCVLEGLGQKVKLLNNFKNIFSNVLI